MLLVLLVSCSEDNIIPDTGENDGTITVSFKTNSGITTRSTSLISSDNLQHVTYVHLYVFDNAGTCVQSKNVNWTQPIGNTAEQYYSLKGLVKGQTYTLLAVGIDEDPTTGKTTYGLTDAIQENVTTLTGLMATLADGKTKDNIANSELFSGWIEVTAGTTASVTINLYRRMAGVLAYIKSIPDNVATIQLKLYKNQYKNVPLQKLNKDNKYDATDHGNIELADSRVLMSIPVTDETKNSTSVNDGHGNTLTKQAGSVLQGAFVLPVEAPDQATTYTLTLETLDTSGTVLKTYNVKVQKTTEDGGTTIDQVITNYPIYANHFYSIGKKNATIDEPIPLGEDLVIRVDPMWEDISDNIPLE